MDYEGMFKDRLLIAGSAAWLEEMVEMGNLEFNPVYSLHDFHDGFGERITTALQIYFSGEMIDSVRVDIAHQAYTVSTDHQDKAIIRIHRDDLEQKMGVVLTDLAWIRIEKVIDTWLNQYS